eukprot:UN00491
MSISTIIAFTCAIYGVTIPLARMGMMECKPSPHAIILSIVLLTLAYLTSLTDGLIQTFMCLLTFCGTLWMYNVEIIGPIPPTVNMSGKVCIVTGANSGIGAETTRQLAQMGATVIMGCRSFNRSKPVMDDINNDPLVKQNGGRALLLDASLDLNDLTSVRTWFKCLRDSGYTAIDTLVCNAGLFVGKYTSHFETINKGKPNEEKVEVEATYCSNHLGHHLLQHLCLPLLRNAALNRKKICDDEEPIKNKTLANAVQWKTSDPSRIILVSSSLHKLANVEQGSYQYTQWPALFTQAQQENIKIENKQLPHDFLAKNYNQWVVYGATKLGEMLSARHFEYLLKNDKKYAEYKDYIHINTLHPGNPVTGVSSNLPPILQHLERIFYPFNFLYRQTCTLGAYNTVWTTTHPDALKTQNSYYVHMAPSPQNPAVFDTEAAKKVYEYSEYLCQE